MSTRTEFNGGDYEITKVYLDFRIDEPEPFGPSSRTTGYSLAVRRFVWSDIRKGILQP